MEKNNLQLNINRDSAVWMLLIPQSLILIISMIWILIFPSDNIIKYLTFKPVLFIYGVGIAFVLAFSGFGVYKVAKIFRDKNKTFDNLVFFFEEALSPIIKKLSLVDVILVSVVSGFCEEVFFRGLLAVKAGIIISSLAFGLLHIPTGKDGKVWFYAVWATLSGMFLAWLFLYYGNLWITIVAHVVNNIIGMILLQRIKA